MPKAWPSRLGALWEAGVRRFLLILTAAIVVILMLVVWLYPSGEDFRADNPFWNGLKTFADRSGAELLDSLDDLPKRSQGTSLVLVPYLPYTAGELDSIGTYLSNGGTVVLMDDFGDGNQVLEYLGVDVRFSQNVLLDPLFNYKSKWLPEVDDFAPGLVTEEVETVVLNHATTLSGVAEADALAWSSRFSYLDINGDSTWQEDEPKGAFTVAALLEVQGSYVAVVADPSVLINSMEDIGNNYAFVQHIAAVDSPQPRILIDQSHLPEAALDQAKSTLSTVRDALSSPAAASVLMVVLLVIVLRPLWRRA